MFKIRDRYRESIQGVDQICSEILCGLDPHAGPWEEELTLRIIALALRSVKMNPKDRPNLEKDILSVLDRIHGSQIASQSQPTRRSSTLEKIKSKFLGPSVSDGLGKSSSTSEEITRAPPEGLPPGQEHFSPGRRSRNAPQNRLVVCCAVVNSESLTRLLELKFYNPEKRQLDSLVPLDLSSLAMDDYDFRCVSLGSDIYVWSYSHPLQCFWSLKVKTGVWEKCDWPDGGKKCTFAHVANGYILFGTQGFDQSEGGRYFVDMKVLGQNGKWIQESNGSPFVSHWRKPVTYLLNNKLYCRMRKDGTFVFDLKKLTWEREMTKDKLRSHREVSPFRILRRDLVGLFCGISGKVELWRKHKEDHMWIPVSSLPPRKPQVTHNVWYKMEVMDGKLYILEQDGEGSVSLYTFEPEENGFGNMRENCGSWNELHQIAESLITSSCISEF